MIVLGIETSCDETAAAVVTGERRVTGRSRALPVRRPRALWRGRAGDRSAQPCRASGRPHRPRDGGRRVSTSPPSTAWPPPPGPGLIGAVMVGLMTGKAIAAVHDKPLLAVNHLEGHALSPRLVDRGRSRIPLPAAAGLGRALPAPPRRGGGPLPPAGHHHRRRGGRGLRQGGDAAGTRLSGRAGDRADGA